LFAEDVEPDFLSKTEIWFSRFRLTSLHHAQTILRTRRTT